MKLIPVSGKEICKIFEKTGFVRAHQKGSHTRYIHPDGRKTVVPYERLRRGRIEICRERPTRSWSR